MKWKTTKENFTAFFFVLCCVCIGCVEWWMWAENYVDWCERAKRIVANTTYTKCIQRNLWNPFTIDAPRLKIPFGCLVWCVFFRKNGANAISVRKSSTNCLVKSFENIKVITYNRNSIRNEKSRHWKVQAIRFVYCSKPWSLVITHHTKKGVNVVKKKRIWHKTRIMVQIDPMKFSVEPFQMRNARIYENAFGFLFEFWQLSAAWWNPFAQIINITVIVYIGLLY